ncbi:MAG: hypothetical protein IT233_04175 [Bacteroidia bacterium]|nr:hypothetical protein [Bacteroidia bacterium]
MNARIDQYFNFAPGKDHVSLILKSIRIQGTPIMPILSVPSFHSHTPVTLISDPHLSYGYDEIDYPIPCINCASGSIGRAEAEMQLTWTSLIVVPPYVNSKPGLRRITNCLGQLDPSISNRCSVCPPNNTLDGLAIGLPQNLFGIELEIVLGTGGVPGFDYCYGTLTTLGPNSLNPPETYATLSRLPGFTYYRRIDPPFSDNVRLKKLQYSIVDRDHYSSGIFLEGDHLTLCEKETSFNSWEESGVRYAFGLGGVYKLSRPGINQQPVYFIFPYAKGFWFSQGPDMRIYYGTNHTQSTCPSGTLEIQQQNETRGCEFCAFGQSFNIPQYQVTDYIISTDLAFLQNYWLDNVISVGIKSAPTSGISIGNTLIFSASNTQPGCINPPSGQPLVVMEVLPDGSYEYIKEFDNNVILPPNTTVWVRVQATFSNGEVISDCQSMTLDSSSTQYQFVTAEIRGSILDYIPNYSGVIYKIEIYQ